MLRVLWGNYGLFFSVLVFATWVARVYPAPPPLSSLIFSFLGALALGDVRAPRREKIKEERGGGNHRWGAELFGAFPRAASARRCETLRPT